MTSSGDMICVPSFIQFGGGVEGMLRFCLKKLKCFNVGITDGKQYEVRR
jgi:hypothetical protein